MRLLPPTYRIPTGVSKMNMKLRATAPRLTLVSLLVGLVLIGNYAFGATITFAPDALSEFQTNGDVIYQDGSSYALSIVSDPAVETPNRLRFTTVISAPDRAAYSHDMIGAFFNPSMQGAISHIDFGIEVNDPIPGFDTGIRFGIEQAGNTYYFSEVSGLAFHARNENSPTFLAFDKDDLTASDFGLYLAAGVDAINSGVNPDFSTSGDNIQFVLSPWSSASISALTRNTDFRNTAIDVHFTPIPEPSTFVLAALGLLAFGFGACCRRRCGQK